MALGDKTEHTPTDADFADSTMSDTSIQAATWQKKYLEMQRAMDRAQINQKMPDKNLIDRIFGKGSPLAPGQPIPIPPPTPSPTLLPENTAVLIIPPILCPECGWQHMAEKLADGLRVKFTHGMSQGCTRSNTCIIRPLAQFTQFI